MKYEELINEAFDNGINQNNRNDVNNAVEKVLNDLNEGVIRVAENSKGNWNVNEYAKKAILLSFKLNQNKCIETNYTKFYDKVDSKFLHTTEDYLKKNNIRIVPQAIARHGSFIDKNVVLMPWIEREQSIGNSGIGQANRTRGYKYGMESWKKWCKKNEVEFFLMDTLLMPETEMVITWQRWYVLEILKSNGIDYDQVLLVDADCIIHPDCPNFFELTDDKFSTSFCNGDFEWVNRAIRCYSQKFFCLF